MKALKVKLAEREAAGGPLRGELTLASIREALGLERHHMTQAVKLRELGWDLEHSHPGYRRN